MVAKDSHLSAHSMAVFGQPLASSLRPELTGIALAVEDCLGEEDLNILTDSLSSMQLLRSMQKGDFKFPLSLHEYPARQLLVHMVKLLSRRVGMGHTLIKVRAHRREPINELADLLEAAAAKSDPAAL